MLTPATALDTVRLEALREQAVALHLAGSLQSAARLYQQLLRVRPRDFQSLLMAGVLAAQSQQLIEAAELLRRAIGVDASSALAWRTSPAHWDDRYGSRCDTCPTGVGCLSAPTGPGIPVHDAFVSRAPPTGNA